MRGRYIMRGWRIVWALWLFPWITVGALMVWEARVAAEDKPALTDVLRLRAELQKTQEMLLEAQYQLATCQAQQRAAALAVSRQKVEREVPAGYTLDWETLTVRPAGPAKDEGQHGAIPK